ncbi:transglutaminase domain-containing protein [Tannerella sp.]|uniref:transglutaminase domain-containing protein n=1 Tax=Tannerella sp. TaxID=2382127 RepID=UPI0026DD0843|nr:transglutaminase domain-containing protein [Tannerella sp.]MDO4704178.1 transglutaminase domain-containing protein [Tannerella sp.]
MMCVAFGCKKPEHFITDRTYREQVSNDFDAKVELFADSSLFAVFDTEMTVPEREAMQFLYAYMPVGDIADYDGEFYLQNVRSSFAVRKEMPWGKNIPEMIFRHFVLPVRVNNENLDESRMVFYEELKERVKGLSLRDAVLEVNHWCHEKVVYTPSDARTSSPLASVRTAYGRCGEESTFTVAALRSVGIPARQVYTPRWAHTDDNHAWVEAWVDGKWYFLGACEPEPVLNLGWFNAPAYRGMLMHTKAFGAYNGPEEVMEQTACYTEINVIDHYAPTGKTVVTVTDSEGKPVEDALVEFKLYNYAEFYSVARKKTDGKGRCSLSAGKGDMLVWATKDGHFGFRKVSFGKDDEVTVALDKTPGDTASIELDIVPPVEGTIAAEKEVTDRQKEENARRMHEEDEIRNRYVATFFTDEQAEALSKELSAASADEVKKIMRKSRGNHAEIEKFMRASGKVDEALRLLNEVSDKDVRDTPSDVLLDHLNHTPSIPENLYESEEKPTKSPSAGLRLYSSYVLNPRVANEFLTPYKQFFAKQLEASLVKAAQANPQALVEWVKEHITVRNDLNPQRIPMMPMGVWKARVADMHSRNIFFVAVARSLGIPARIEPVTGKVQYYDCAWFDVDFEAAMGQANAPQGDLSAAYRPIKALDNPKYYSHFTIARLKDDARLQTLNFETEADMGAGDTWKDLLQSPRSLRLDEGNYLLVSGTRMASGKVLARLSFFPVEADKKTTVDLVMRHDDADIQVIGNINAEAKYRTEKGEETTILNTTGRGYFVIGILGARQEPTNHAMRDIAKLKADFEQWNRSMILLFKNEQNFKLFDRNEFGELPSTVTFGTDESGEISRMITDAMKLSNSDSLPIFIIADTFGRVVFVSQGYTIGLGEQMMKVIHQL